MTGTKNASQIHIRMRTPAREVLSLLLAITWIQPGLNSTLITQAQTKKITASGETQGADSGLTLPLAVEIALRGNPLIRAAASGRDIADAQLGAARADRFPLLEFNETIARSNNPVFVFGSLLEQGRFTAQNFDLTSLNNPDAINNLRTSLTFKLPLFDQGKTRTRIAQARLMQEQADAETELVAQQIRFEVVRAYYGVLLAGAKKQVADETIKLAEADVKRSRDRVESGVSVHSDLLAAEVQLAEFRQQQIEAQGQVITAIAALNTALGLGVNTPQKVNGALVEKNFDLGSQEEMMSLALLHRPDYSRARLALREREQQTRGARGEFFPRLETFASFGVSSQVVTRGSSDYTIGASLSFNLFDAGRRARIAQAHAAEHAASAEQEHLANQIKLEVVRAYQQYISARERLTVAERVIGYAVEALAIVQDRYQEGLTTITEVLRAETSLMRARLNVLAARYDHYLGYANVLLASGRLTDVQPFGS